MGTEQHDVDITLTDGGLGVVNADSSGAIGMIGVAASGTAEQVYPLAGTDTDTAPTTFGAGDLPDQAVKHLLESGGKTVYAVRGTASTAGAAGAATLLSGTGPTVPTFGGAPTEDAEVRIKIISTGSATTATWQISFSKGRSGTYGATRTAGAALSLGQGSTITFPVGTYTAGAIFGSTFVGPRNTLTNVGDASDALIESPYRFSMLHVLDVPADAAALFTLAAALDAKAQAAVSVGKMFDFMLEAPAVDPDLLVTAADGFEGKNVVIFGGYADIYDANDRIIEKRSIGRGIVPRLARNALSISAQRNTTDTDVEPVFGLANAIWPEDALHTGVDGYIDSRRLPGLNDARFSCACNIPGRGGSYSSNVFTFAAGTSDYSWYPNKRAANTGRQALFDWGWKQSQRRLPLDAAGNIDPRVATGLQGDANDVLRKVLVDGGHATRVACVLDRNSPTVLRLKARAQLVSHNRTTEVDFGLALALAA